jgi:SAM-dependent methyltransferase
MTDVWASGDAYESYIGRWSRLIAREFLAWLAVARGARWLDVGCGTGALTNTIIAVAQPAHVYGVDPSFDFVATARTRVPPGIASFTIGDARALPEREGSVDVVASGLALNFVPQPDAALVEIRRVVRPGGMAGAYVWDYADRMQLIRRFWDAAISLDPGAAVLDEALRFPMCQPRELEALFSGAGFAEVTSRAIEVPTRFRDFDDFWTPFLGGQGPAPSYITRLGDAERAALRERLRSMLTTGADGSIDLVARAWAVRGTR